MTRDYEPLIVNRSLSAKLKSIEVKEVENEQARQVLGELLQSALQLEFATIPVYLSAAFSLDSSNERVQLLLFRVAREEMFHMTAVANIMNAIGVAPDIAGAVPTFPYDLTVLEPPLRLDLRSFSFALVEELLMKIEAPEVPVQYPSALPLARPKTIGQFYASIIDIIERGTIPGLFDNAERDFYKQVSVNTTFRKFAYANNDDLQDYGLTPEIDLLIKDAADAVRHLQWIVDQGEGAEPLDPLTAEGIPGHYYRLESIVRKKYLVPNRGADLQFSFTGADLLFNATGVHDFDVNSKLSDYTAYPRLARQMKRFNESYTAMVTSLQSAFNCPLPTQKDDATAAYDQAIARMRDLSNIATEIVRKAKESAVKAGMPFEYGP